MTLELQSPHGLTGEDVQYVSQRIGYLQHELKRDGWPAAAGLIDELARALREESRSLSAGRASGHQEAPL